MVRFCLSANEVLNKVRVRIALNYLLNRADALGQSFARSEPSYRNYFSTIVGYSGLHGKPR
jgi:ABC-type oligopeptide transport system substrate-binding subunit